MTKHTEQRRSIPEMSIDARLLYERLVKVKPGESIAYADLDEVIGRSVQDHRGYLTTARRAALREHEMVFEAVFGEGLKRLTDQEIALTGESAVRGIGRAARRGVKKLTCVQNFDTLSDDAKVKHNTYVSMLGAVAAVSRRTSVEKLESEVAKAQAKLPLAATLESFKA